MLDPGVDYEGMLLWVGIVVYVTVQASSQWWYSRGKKRERLEKARQRSLLSQTK